MRRIMACLDVGSDTIKLVVGEMNKKKLNILAVSELESVGVKNGYVEDPNLLLEPLKNIIKKCEEIIGLSIKQMVVAVSSNKASFEVVTGEIPITNDGNLVQGKDVIKVMQQAISNRKKTDELEYISLMTTSFSLDDNRIVKDPKGLTSKALAIRGVLSSTPKRNIYPILACLERLGIDVLDITLLPIGDYYEFKTKETETSVGAVINIGGDTTNVSIFNKGILTSTTSFNLGGSNIDNDISFVYKLDNKVSQKLKETFAVSLEEAKENEIKEVEDRNKNQIKVNQKEISEIVTSRLEEILNLAKKEINNLTKKEISYIMVTGGMAESKCIQPVLNKLFTENIIIGNIEEIGVRHNKFSSCLGIIKFYAYNARLKDKDYSIFSIEEQQSLSGNTYEDDDSIIGKLFGYIFNG